MISVSEIQRKLYYRYNTHEFHLSNAFIFAHDWESDHFCVSKSGYSYEFEIKLSKADFKKDFEKYKHRYFSNIKKRYVVENRGEGKGDTLHVENVKIIQQYGSYMSKQYTYAPTSKVRITDLEKELLPNRFFFVCPKDLIAIKDIPDYAGLIYVSEYEILVAKEAPLIHRKKHNLDGILVRKFYHRYLPTAYYNQKNQ